jgi:hypothetical protein
MSDCIGSLDISELDIQCEVPTSELGPDFKEQSISFRFENILKMLNRIESQVNTINEILPSDILNKKISSLQDQWLDNGNNG